MVKISPLIASMLIGLAAALPQQQQEGPSGTVSFELPTGTGFPIPSGTGSFGGFGAEGFGGQGFGAAPTGMISHP